MRRISVRSRFRRKRLTPRWGDSLAPLLDVIFLLVIFLLLEASPGDPLADVPLTVPPEVKEKMREALGLGQAWYIRYVLWLKQFFWVEPVYWFDQAFGTDFSAARMAALRSVTKMKSLKWPA